MFGFEPEEAKKLGSKGRFTARIEKFRKYGSKTPILSHYCEWLFHNIVAHGLLALIPCYYTFRLHDWSSRRLNAEHLRKRNWCEKHNKIIDNMVAAVPVCIDCQREFFMGIKL